jgi:hypothetical protein
MERDYTGDVVALCYDIHQAQISLQKAAVSVSATSSSSSPIPLLSSLDDWTPFLLHDCLVGLLSVDFASNEKARKLLSVLLKVAQGLIRRNEESSITSASSSSGDKYLKLYHALLYLQGRAFQLPDQHYDPVSSVLTKPLYNRLLGVIAEVEVNLALPPLQAQENRALAEYSSCLEEIVRGLAAPTEFNSRGYQYRMSETRRHRRLRVFYNTYLHGFHADMVLVGYWCSSRDN